MKYTDLTCLPTITSSLIGICRVLVPVLNPGQKKILRTGVRAILKAGPAQIPAEEEWRHSMAVLRCTLEIFAGKVEPDPAVLAAITGFAIEQRLGASDKLNLPWPDEEGEMIRSLLRADTFTGRATAADPDNYRGLLLSIADDIRVVIAMTVRSLASMRLLHLSPNKDNIRTEAFEAGCLYAQLAHRLGLYYIKSELEDLSLKFTNRDIYKQIASKLNQTKASRDAYIAKVIRPIKEKLEAAGLKFEIKGRTKSISSIWNKIKNKKVDINHIYDLFALRVILDSPPQREKSDCWLAYSIVTDMYTANPARMRDWISIPKSNGYESLHATVLGPDNHWLEVQFRTRRMDLVAEKGLAAHWKYKGGKTDPTDRWMRNIRDILETAESGPLELMKDMKMSDFDKEVFVFTPRGDLLRLAGGSTVLDFAFAIHSRIGCQCTGAIVNGRHERISYRLRSGDTVDVSTSSTQRPKPDWLHIVVSSKARSKIRQSLGEEKQRLAKLGKETIERRMHNRKEEYGESVVASAIAEMGYRHMLDFYSDVASEKIDPSKFLAVCKQIVEDREEPADEVRSAEGFKAVIPEQSETDSPDAVVIGDGSVSGMKFKMAGCCQPIHGDKVFGFISGDGSVKIHRSDCPNAPHLRRRYPYRLIPARWSAQSGEMLPATLRVTGRDDIGIVTTITSVIAKEPQASLRSISVDSEGGLFRGTLVVHVASQGILTSLIKKISTLKGVKDIKRIV